MTASFIGIHHNLYFNLCDNWDDKPTLMFYDRDHYEHPVQAAGQRQRTQCDGWRTRPIIIFQPRVPSAHLMTFRRTAPSVMTGRHDLPYPTTLSISLTVPPQRDDNSYKVGLRQIRRMSHE